MATNNLISSKYLANVFLSPNLGILFFSAKVKHHLKGKVSCKSDDFAPKFGFPFFLMLQNVHQNRETDGHPVIVLLDLHWKPIGNNGIVFIFDELECWICYFDPLFVLLFVVGGQKTEDGFTQSTL